MNELYKKNVAELKYLGIYNAIKSLRQIQMLESGRSQHDIRKDWETLIGGVPNRSTISYICSMSAGMLDVPIVLLNIAERSKAAYDVYKRIDGGYDIEKIKEYIENEQF